MLEREYSLGERALVPYASAEIYYDTRFDTFNRYRLTGGVQFHLKKRTSRVLDLRRQETIELYYKYQHDSHSNPSRVHAIGLTFAKHF